MKNNISKCLAIVVPCLNEQEVLLKTNYELLTLLDALTENNLINLKSYILFVDDENFLTQSAKTSLSKLGLRDLLDGNK